jgi:hypothetical protein
MKTITPKIKYKLYGINADVSDALNASKYYPIPSTPEFDSYAAAKTFYDDTVTHNENFYRVGSSDYFKTIVIAKTLMLLPHKTTSGHAYLEEDYTYDELDGSKGLTAL